MSLPKNLHLYKDCEDLFFRALSSPKGIAFEAESPSAATHMAHRLNTYRSLLRKQSSAIHPVDSPEYGKTPYDKLAVRSPKESREITIEPTQDIPIINLREL